MIYQVTTICHTAEPPTCSTSRVHLYAVHIPHHCNRKLYAPKRPVCNAVCHNWCACHHTSSSCTAQAPAGCTHAIGQLRPYACNQHTSTDNSAKRTPTHAMLYSDSRPHNHLHAISNSMLSPNKASTTNKEESWTKGVLCAATQRRTSTYMHKTRTYTAGQLNSKQHHT